MFPRRSASEERFLANRQRPASRRTPTDTHAVRHGSRRYQCVDRPSSRSRCERFHAWRGHLLHPSPPPRRRRLHSPVIRPDEHVVMWTISLPHWHEFIIRAVVVYGFLMLLLRFTGKRQVGQLAPFDLVLLLVLSNALQNSMNGGDNSVTGGFILATTLGAAD